VVYDTPGTKTARLTVCVGTSVAKTLTVQEPRPSALVVITTPIETYAGDLVRLTAKASGKAPISYRWALPPATTTTSNPATLDARRMPPGLVQIGLRASNSYGSASRTLVLNLRDPKPRILSLALTPAQPRLGSLLVATPTASGRPPLSYSWSLDGHLLGRDRVLSWTAADVGPGQHTLALSVSNPQGSATLTRPLSFTQPLILTFDPVCPQLLCLVRVDSPITFTLLLDPQTHPLRYDYDWIGTGPFTESSSSPIPQHSYSAPGNYRPRVRVTTPLGSEIRFATQFLLVTR
jgi:hypothetical protein